MRPRRTTLAILSTALIALPTGAIVSDAPAKRGKGDRSAWRFPVRGDHDYGGEQGRFGVKRPDGSIHTGQDVLAPCGTPLVAAHRARVVVRTHSKATGNVMVLQAIGKNMAFVYAHMKSAGSPGKGKVVKAGRRIGSVGATGSSIKVCHLHFEIWKGEYVRGHRVDSMKRLRRWDKHSEGEVVPQAKKSLIPTR